MTGTVQPKRFYKEAAAVPFEDGYTIELDGRPIRTPMKAHVWLPRKALADAIADEWAVQGEKVNFRAMPLMGFASTAIDRVTPRRNGVVDEIAAYGETDLLCYRAERPPELVARQEAHWQPRLDWLAETHGARLTVTSGVVHVQQAAEALAKVREAVDRLDDYGLAALHSLTTGTGSVVLGLAVAAGILDSASAAAAGHLDEQFQAEQWGEDRQASERRAHIARELADAERFLHLLKHR